MALIVHEIFLSLEGETVTAGFPAAFIRLAGCNLNCRWCDTREARSGGTPMSLQSVLNRVIPLKAHHVTVTGGEPLCQEECIPLMEALVSSGLSVQLETNGSLPLTDVPRGIRIIADVKTPSSGEVRSFLMDNVSRLESGDEVKFIIADEPDYEFARDFMNRYLNCSGAVADLSPAHGSISAEELAGWMLRDRVRARLNLQIHKIIWGEKEGKIVL